MVWKAGCASEEREEGWESFERHYCKMWCGVRIEGAWDVLVKMRSVKVRGPGISGFKMVLAGARLYDGGSRNGFIAVACSCIYCVKICCHMERYQI